LIAILKGLKAIQEVVIIQMSKQQPNGYVKVIRGIAEYFRLTKIYTNLKN